MTPALQAQQERCDKLLLHMLGTGGSEFNPAAQKLLYRVFEASAYTLNAGGKRVRPMLVYSAAAAINSDILQQQGIDYVACALEMIHSYSLVHDDMPAMDDDDLRRGKPTCHIAFDEATAMLVGDGLQARAFELLSEAPGLDAGIRVQLVQCLAAAAGMRGMVGGQAIDIAAADREISLQHLESMHALKTGALIRAAVRMGAITAMASNAQLEALDDYADAIGLAFQIQDDVLDVDGDSLALGKNQGSDAELNKPTWVSLMGLEGARAKVEELAADADAALDLFGEDARLLRDLTGFITQRNH
jgi:geranylgeranyl pyrophosphate synthase